jgi:hypothetical protein
MSGQPAFTGERALSGYHLQNLACFPAICGKTKGLCLFQNFIRGAKVGELEFLSLFIAGIVGQFRRLH